MTTSSKVAVPWGKGFADQTREELFATRDDHAARIAGPRGTFGGKVLLANAVKAIDRELAARFDEREHSSSAPADGAPGLGS